MLPATVVAKHQADLLASLEKLYTESKLPYSPDEEKLKALLLACLEEHYGSLGASEIVLPGVAERTLSKISESIKNYERLKNDSP